VAGGFKLGGIDASEFGIRLLQGTQVSMLPDTRDITAVIPGVHGAYDFGAMMDVRTFELKCAMTGAGSPTELQQQVRTFVQHLVDTNGQPRTLSLVFDEEPDKTYYVRYSGSAPLEQIVSIGIFTLPLVAFDPCAYGVEQEVEQVVETSPDTITVTSHGNVSTPPVIVLYNEGTNTITGFTLQRFEPIE